MFGLFKKFPSVTLKTFPYPAGKSHSYDILYETLKFRGVEIDGGPNDRRIIYADSAKEVDQMASRFYGVQMDAGWVSDLGNPERLDCDKRVSLFQAWAIMCMAKHPTKEHGGHGVMRLTVKYGATSWGYNFDGAIPPNSTHQMALIAMPVDPMVIDVECGRSIRLSNLQEITGNPPMKANW